MPKKRGRPPNKSYNERLELTPEALRDAGAMTEYEKVKDAFHLTYRRYMFCKYFVNTNNAAESARLAGYSGDKRNSAVRGCRLLQEDNVKQYILHLKNKKESKEVVKGNKKITMDEVLDLYIDLINKTDNDSVKRAALADVTKILGGFAPKEINVNQSINISNQLHEARQRQIEYIRNKEETNTIDVIPE